MPKLRLLSVFTLLVLALVNWSCDDEADTFVAPITDLAVDFTAEFADRPLSILAESYSYPTGAELRLVLFQYYVSDLSLISANGDTVRLEEIDLIRYRDAGGSATISRQFAGVPTGDYTGVTFGLGVKPELNNVDPNNFAADFVLNENEFWSPRTRYVFAKIEANAQLPGSTTFDTGLTYHLGSNELYRRVELNQRFTLRSSQDRLEIVADVLRAMVGSDNEPYDISDPDQRIVHGANQAVARELWEGLAGQFSLNVR